MKSISMRNDACVEKTEKIWITFIIEKGEKPTPDQWSFDGPIYSDNCYIFEYEEVAIKVCLKYCGKGRIRQSFLIGFTYDDGTGSLEDVEVICNEADAEKGRAWAEKKSTNSHLSVDYFVIRIDF